MIQSHTDCITVQRKKKAIINDITTVAEFHTRSLILSNQGAYVTTNKYIQVSKR